MAILKGIEGRSHVELEEELVNWQGFIYLDPNPSNIRYFDIAGPNRQGVYEGPVLAQGKFYFMNGKVQITNVKYVPGELRVEFIGIEKANLVKPLSDNPGDYIP